MSVWEQKSLNHALWMGTNSYNFKFFKIGHYLLKQLLGSGGYGQVYKAIQIYTKQQLAVKVIKLDKLSKTQLQQLEHEISIHQQLCHPNIIKIYEVLKTQQRTYIFMELARGMELYKYIIKFGPLDQKKAAKVFYQLLCTVKYLHNSKIIHRDIKTQNVVVDEFFNIKLLDFGLAINIKDRDNPFLTTICGSPSYTAPQLILNKTYIGQKVDVWCLGVCLYVMLQATFPFEPRNKRYSIPQNEKFFQWFPTIFSSHQAVELYKDIFTESSKRVNLDQILHSEFIRRYQKFYFRFILDYDVQYEVTYQKRRQIQRKISVLLNKTEQSVNMQIIKNQLGQAFCLYHLLLSRQKQNQKQFNRKKSLQLKAKPVQINLQKQPYLKDRIHKQTPSKIGSKKMVNIREDQITGRSIIFKPKTRLKSTPAQLQSKKSQFLSKQDRQLLMNSLGLKPLKIKNFKYLQKQRLLSKSIKGNKKLEQIHQKDIKFRENFKEILCQSKRCK